MTNSSATRPTSRKILFSLIFLGFVLLILIGVAEGGARVMGYSPWRPEARQTKVEPEGGFFDMHERYGYAMKPGRYTLTLNDSLAFEAHHDELGMRIGGGPEAQANADSLTDLWVLGGSFTYGWGIADHEAFPSLMEEALDSLHVVNFGTGGYGTLQNLYQLEDMLATGKRPEAVILAYASFHDQRNTCNRYWMKAIAPQSVLEGLTFPWARLDEQQELQFGTSPVAYDPYPGMKIFAFMHALEQSATEAEENLLNSPEVSYQLIHRMHSLCQKEGIPFFLAGIEPDGATQMMLEKCANDGMVTCDMSVDRNEEGMSLMPHDPHPSAAAHEVYAKLLLAQLAGMGIGE